MNIKSGTYCAKHGTTIARRYNGTIVPDEGGPGRKQETTYTHIGTTPMAQSIAYAKYYVDDAGPEVVQNLIWASDQWLNYTGASCLAVGSKTEGPYKAGNGSIYERASKFAEFVYKGLNTQTGKLELQCSITEDNDDRLKIMVNQNDDTYTLGPYILSFPEQDTKLDSPSNGTLGELVWDEIVSNPDHQFIKGVIDATIAFQGNYQTIDNTKIEVLDEGGDVIKENFPYFGKKFYIRYKSDKNGPIVNFIKPRVKIDYLKEFDNAYCNLYAISEVKFSMKDDNADLLFEALKAFGGGASAATSQNDQLLIKTASSNSSDPIRLAEGGDGYVPPLKR